jgi:hypothetical protein
MQSWIIVQNTKLYCWPQVQRTEWQYRKYCTSEAKKALVGITGDFVFLFYMIFLIFFQHKKQQNRSYTKFHLKHRSDVVYRKRASSLKSVQELWRIFSLFSWIFWQFYRKQTGHSQVWLASEWCQQAPVKISDFLNNRAKSYARFKEGTSSYV